MFQILNNLREKLARRMLRTLSGKSSRRGQTAMILVFIIAIAIIIYAATLNWSRVTQYKTLTIMGSNLAAANMASIIASYGEQQLQVNLGGRPKYCERTNFMVMVAVIIIIIIVVIVTWGATSFLLISAIALVALALAVAALVINLVIIQPGLTTLWNKMQDALLTMEDKVVENGIMTALQSSITDPVTVQDHFDMDLDGQWVDDLGRNNVVAPADKLSRFAYYYTQRLKLLEPVRIPEVDRFVESLNELIYDNPYGKVGPHVPAAPPNPESGCTQAQQGSNAVQCQVPDNFGLFDPGCTDGKLNDGTASPYCNSCCQPDVDSRGNLVRPASCANLPTGVPVESACTVGVAYPAGPVDADGDGVADPVPPYYYYQYDPFYEDYTNAFLSFREKLGVDDEHIDYVKRAADPNGLQSKYNWIPTNREFYKADASGYYPNPPETREGIFPFFWDMGALNLANPVILAPLAPPYPYVGGASKPDNVAVMTFDPATGTNRFQTQETMCALDRYDRDLNNPKGFWWKPGMDHFCSTEYPYYDCGARSGGCTPGNFDGTVPTCGCVVSANPSEWREDPVDAFTDGLKGFISWSQPIIDGFVQNKTAMYNTFPTWYEGAANWIAPRCDPAWNCDGLNGLQPQCSYCNNQDTDGYLIFWRDQMANWIDLLDQWLHGRWAADATEFSFEDPTAWCLPPDAPPNLPNLPPTEIKAILDARPLVFPVDRNRNPMAPVWGNLNDTIACLDFNTNNETKFNACLTACTTTPATAADSCLNLPRSAVPGFDLTSWEDAALTMSSYREAQQLQNCLSSTCCATQPCQGPGLDTVLPVCQGLPGVTVATDCRVFRSAASAFYDDIKAQRDARFAASNACPADTTLPRNQFMLNIEASREAARQQTNDPVNGFIARRNKLTALQAQGQAVRDVLFGGYQKFDEFLRPCRAGSKLGENCGDCSTSNNNAQLLRACLDSSCSDASTGAVLPVCQGLPGVTQAVNCVNFGPGNAFYDQIKTEYDRAAATGGGVAANLICARADYVQHTTLLPNYAIYGWRSPGGKHIRRQDPDDGLGYWHIVRVEAFAPKRCFNSCGTNEFPKVKTYTKWKFNAFTGPDQYRCYELVKTDGLVIARVTRYDESHNPRTGFTADFANTQRIWNFRFDNPGATPGLNANTTGLKAACAPPPAWTDNTSIETKQELGNAFMLNENPHLIVDESQRMYSTECWDKANALLETGVSTTTCARYYLDRSIDHMNLKFTTCPSGALQRVFTCAANGGC